jgi:malonyl-ACP decarboxylase
MSQETVHITGMSVLTPIGKGIRDFAEGLKQGRSGFQEWTMTHADQQYKFPIGKMDGFELKEELSKLNIPDPLLLQVKKLRNLSTTASTGIYCALDSWNNANLFNATIDPTRVAIVVCGSNIQQQHLYTLQEKHRGKLQHINVNYGINFMDSDVVGVISELLNIRGEGYSLGAASASGNMGLIQGTRLIRNGLYDAVLVVAPMTELSVYEYAGFTEMGAMARLKEGTPVSNICRPFDEQHAGFVFGQNAGCILLESATHVNKRNVPSVGTIAGVGVSLDANRNPNPSSEGETRAMQQAMNDANTKPEQITYVNTHGTASMIGDKTEVKALLDAGLYGVMANSTKSLIGHGLTAAGLVETIACFIQMNEDFLHASANLSNPISSEIKWITGQTSSLTFDCCLNNSYGFGGINTSIILKTNKQ